MPLAEAAVRVVANAAVALSWYPEGQCPFRSSLRLKPSSATSAMAEPCYYFRPSIPAAMSSNKLAPRSFRSLGFPTGRLPKCFRSSHVPVRDLLILVRDVEQPRLVEIIADELQTHRALADEAGRDGHAGQPRHVHRDGVDVGEIHGDRIAALLADVEGDGGRGRPRDHVDLFEGVADELAQLLRLQVIRVVIAGRQHVGADHDAALHFRAEAFAARALVEIEQIFRRLTAVTETHAVVAREIRRGLGGCDDVI